MSGSKRMNSLPRKLAARNTTAKPAAPSGGD